MQIKFGAEKVEIAIADRESEFRNVAGTKHLNHRLYLAQIVFCWIAFATARPTLAFRRSGQVLLGGPLALPAKFFDFRLGQMFDTDETIFDLSYTNQLVQLD